MEEIEEGTRTRRLGELRDALERARLSAKMMQPSQAPPYVRVVNPASARLSENVSIQPYTPLGQCREPWFFTSFGHPLAPATDPQKAAAQIARIIDTASRT